eukprot:512864_1
MLQRSEQQEEKKTGNYNEDIIEQLITLNVATREEIVNAIDNVINKNDINEITDYIDASQQQQINALNNEIKEEKEEEPLFSVGLIADTQYADADVGQNYTKTRTRRYRQALTITENAMK